MFYYIVLSPVRSDLERLFSLFCRLAMLVAAVAGWKLTLAARHTAARHRLTPVSYTHLLYAVQTVQVI